MMITHLQKLKSILWSKWIKWF